MSFSDFLSQVRRFIALLLLVFVASVCQASDLNKYVGLVYPPNPQGLSEKGGGLVKGSASEDGLWYVDVELDGKSMIWLQRLIKRVEKRPIWQVKDVLMSPIANKDETIHIGYDIECSYKGIRDISIIAIGKWTWRKPPLVGGYAHHIRQAWRTHPTLDKFEEISPRDVLCELNEDRD